MAIKFRARNFLCRSRLLLWLARVAVLALVPVVLLYGPDMWLKLGYFLRPLWDRAPPPFVMVPHFYAEDLGGPEDLCRLNNWTLRGESPRRVFDAIIFSHEIDILEIRICELWDVVDYFVVLESNVTFTGHRKPLVLHDTLNTRFAFAREKLRVGFMPGAPLGRREGPFDNENRQRKFMNRMLEDAGVQHGDLVIMADADEVPYAHTVDLLRRCNGFPPVMHLQMKNYLYSFEFPVDQDSWRAAALVYHSGSSSFYGHGRRSDALLADAGFHCSFCFRHISEFIFKMQAYSHADRVRHPHLLNPERIQRVICKGTDIFDFLPEAYTFRTLVSKMGATPPSFSGVGLPKCLLRDMARFQFLVPGRGNCIREPAGPWVPARAELGESPAVPLATISQQNFTTGA